MVFSHRLIQRNNRKTISLNAHSCKIANLCWQCKTWHLGTNLLPVGALVVQLRCITNIGRFIISLNLIISYNINVPTLCQKDIWKSDRADPIEKLPSLSNIVGNSIGFQLYLLIYIWRNICPELIP